MPLIKSKKDIQNFLKQLNIVYESSDIDEMLDKYKEIYKDEHDAIYNAIGELIVPKRDINITEIVRKYDTMFIPPEIKPGINVCKTCGSNRTITIFRETRSADEGATAIITCTGCGAEWTQN